MSRLRTALFRELGVTVLWRLRSVGPTTPDSGPLSGTIADPGEGSNSAASHESLLDAAPTSPSRTHHADRAGRQNLDRPTTTKLIKERRPDQPTGNTDQSPQDHDDRQKRIAQLGWDALEEDIRQCAACRLCENRRQAVPGVGDRAANWMFVGEAPGAEEDRKGEPFVGPAGKLLDKMLDSIGLTRGEDVYIANAVKCRPPSNRTPQSEEIAQCRHYLRRQISLVQPSLIFALGRPAAQSLLGTDVKINEVRGKVLEHAGTPVIISYHPSYLLRNPADKAKTWQDLCFARSVMKEKIGRG